MAHELVAQERGRGWVFHDAWPIRLAQARSVPCILAAWSCKRLWVSPRLARGQLLVTPAYCGAETGAAIAVWLHCTATRSCRDVRAQDSWVIGVGLQRLRLSLACTMHGIPAPCASSPELILHSICASPSPPNFKTLPCRSLGHVFPSFPFSLRESTHFHSFINTSFLFAAAIACLVYAQHTPSDFGI